VARPSKYASEFRREAVELVRQSGRTIAEVARSLGVSDGTLGNWVKADREELKRLRRETAQQQIDLEILRKAADRRPLCLWPIVQLGQARIVPKRDGPFLRKPGCIRCETRRGG
jgi:transposase